MATHTYISLFSGAGGLDLALRIAEPSARCIGYCEREGPAAAILAARMAEGVLDAAPIWSDVRTFPSELYRGRVDGIIGGFPCTDLSVAGRRAGITGEHSGLWFEYARLIREIQPRWVFIENVPPVLHLGAGSAVLGELAAQRFDAEWLSIRASDVGAPHRRERVFIYAWRAWMTPHGMNGIDSTGKVGAGGEFAKQATNWPTPSANDDNKSPEAYRHMREHKLGRTGKAAETVSSLNVLVKMWPTPRSEDSESAGNHPGAVDSLTGATKLWTTPQAHDAAGGNPTRVRRHGTKHGCANLADDVTLWSTPQARDTHNPSTPDSERSKRKAEQGWTIDLNEQAAWWKPASAWPTPKSRDYRSAEGPAGDGRQSPDLNVTASRFSLLAPETSTHGGESSPSGQTSRPRLNPKFAAWLMGWHPDYTNYALSETGSCLWLERLRTEFLRIVRRTHR